MFTGSSSFPLFMPQILFLLHNSSISEVGSVISCSLSKVLYDLEEIGLVF